MELSTFAFILGILELSIGIPIVFAAKDATKILNKFFKDELHLRFSGALMIMIAASVLQDGYQIGSDVAGVLRTVAWLMALKGVFYLWWPDSLGSLRKQFLGSEAGVSFWGMVAVAVGLLLVYASVVV